MTALRTLAVVELLFVCAEVAPGCKSDMTIYTSLPDSLGDLAPY